MTASLNKLHLSFFPSPLLLTVSLFSSPTFAPALALPLPSSHPLSRCLVFPPPPASSLSSSPSVSRLLCLSSGGCFLVLNGMTFCFLKLFPRLFCLKHCFCPAKCGGKNRGGIGRSFPLVSTWLHSIYVVLRNVRACLCVHVYLVMMIRFSSV